MAEKNIGISQQTLVSNYGESRNKPRKLPQYVAGLASTLGALAAGMVLGWTSPAGSDGENLNANSVYPFLLDKVSFSWVSSSFNLGAATICVPIGILCDHIGRKTSMLLLTVPFTIGWACVIWPNSVATLIAGRYILGVSGGAFCVTAPMYATEIADSETRGRLGSYFQLMLTAGILLTYVLGSIPAITMFALSMISAAIPLIFCVVFFFMPESPTYYLIKGDVDSARKMLVWLRGPSYDVDYELEEQRKALEKSQRPDTSFFDAIKSRPAVRGLIIGFGLMLFQQLSGVNAIIFYAGQIFKESIGEESVPTIVLGVMQVLAVFASTMIVDKLGRRLLLLVSSVSMCLTTLVFGVYFYLKDHGPSMANMEWLPLVCICGFIILFSLGFGPIPWMMMGEIFSSQVKGVAGSSACLFNWLMAFVVTKFYSDIKEEIQSYGTFWIFSCICALGTVFVFFVVPETKGKTSEQIQIELSARSIRVQGVVKTT